MDYLQELLSSGATPMELMYSPAYSFRGNFIAGFRAVLQLSSPDLGTLLPEHYQAVANRDSRCIKLAQWALSRACEDLNVIGGPQKPEFVLVSVPVKMLMRGILTKHLAKLKDDNGLSPALRLCLDLSSDLLYEDGAAAKDALWELKELGVALALSEYGSEFCPNLRLQDLPFDYVILDPSLTEQLAGDIPTGPRYLITLAHELGMKAVLTDLSDPGLLRTAAHLGADYYIMQGAPARLSMFSAESETGG